MALLEGRRGTPSRGRRGQTSLAPWRCRDRHEIIAALHRPARTDKDGAIMARHLPTRPLDLASFHRVIHEHVHGNRSGRPTATARARPARSSTSTSGRFVPWNARRPSPGGTPMSPAATRISRPRKRRRTASMPRSPTMPASTRLKAIKAARLADPALARQIAVLYLLYLEKQVDPELLRQITAKANAIEKTFNGYRANVNGRMMTDSEVRRVLKESRDSGRAQGRLGREQGGRSARRGRPEGTGQAAERGRTQAGFRRLSRAPASSRTSSRKNKSSSSSTSSTR